MSMRVLIHWYMLRITYVPQLLCYPELATLDLTFNSISMVAEQRGLSVLTSLEMSYNRLQHVSMLKSLQLLVSLTVLDLQGNAMTQNSRQAPLLPIHDWQSSYSDHAPPAENC